MSLLKVNEVQNYNGSSLTLTASTVSTSAQLNTGGNISVTGSINVSDDSTTRSNLGLGSIATQDSSNVSVTGGSITGTTIVPTSPFSFRNLLINGSLDIWQRGTTNASVSNSYLADRIWTASTSSTDQSTDAPDGFNYSIKLTYGSTDMAIGQAIELFKTGSSKPFVAGETVTLSYYAKVDSGTEGILSNIYFRDSKFSSASQSAFTYSNNVQTLTTSWQRFSMQFTVPSVNGTNELAALEISGISKTAYFTGFQLEKGSVATPFEHRPISVELSLCQRYYQKFSAYTVYSFFAQGPAYGTTYARVGVPAKTIMRAIPTLGQSAAGTFYLEGGSASTVSSIAPYGTLTPDYFIWQVDTSGTISGSVWLYANNTLTAYLDAFAEL